MRRIAIIASSSGNGKTTLGRHLAKELGVPFIELDALVHGHNWTETSDEELKRILKPIVNSERWVIDGMYERKLGHLVIDRADTILWLDLPIRVWFSRLLFRTIRRFARREQLWNGNQETLRTVFWGPNCLFVLALRMHLYRRRNWPKRFAGYPVQRLRSQREVEAWLATVPSLTAQAGDRAVY